MSASPRFTEEFKRAVVDQVTDRGHSVADVARRLKVPLSKRAKEDQRVAGLIKQA